MLYFNMVKVKNSWTVTSSDPIRFQGATIMLRGQVSLEVPYHYGHFLCVNLSFLGPKYLT
jgi:hypothetical protein